MGARRIVFGMAGAALMFSAGGAASVHAAALPAATQAALKKLDLSPDLMYGLDEELTLPQALLDGARQAGVVRVLGTWDPKQFGIMNGPFRERFPDIKVEYARAGMVARGQRTLIAFKEGRYVTDILTGFSSFDEHWRGTDALENLRDLPGFKNPLPNTSGEDGTWVGTRIRYCDQINNRRIAFRAPEQADAPNELNQVWAKYWTAGGGQRSDTPEDQTRLEGSHR